jgi:hypothetical protein
MACGSGEILRDDGFFPLRSMECWGLREELQLIIFSGNAKTPRPSDEKDRLFPTLL